jgi:hypothetical protein
MFRHSLVIIWSFRTLTTLVKLLKDFKHECTYTIKPYTVLSKASDVTLLYDTKLSFETFFMQFQDPKIFHFQLYKFISNNLFLFALIIVMYVQKVFHNFWLALCNATFVLPIS